MPDTFIYLITVYLLKLSGRYWVVSGIKIQTLVHIIPVTTIWASTKGWIWYPECLWIYSFCSPHFNDLLFKLPLWIPITHMMKSLFDLASAYVSDLTAHHSPNPDPHPTMCNDLIRKFCFIAPQLSASIMSTKTFLHIHPENPCASSAVSSLGQDLPWPLRHQAIPLLHLHIHTGTYVIHELMTLPGYFPNDSIHGAWCSLIHSKTSIENCWMNIWFCTIGPKELAWTNL